MKSLEQDLLKELIHYDPDTGVFTWREARANGRIKAGSVAGGLDSYGYRIIGVSSKVYKAHRLAWVYIHGVIPEGYTIDHINGAKDDNSIGNLRLATNAEQQQNRPVTKNIEQGKTGIWWDVKRKKWRASIRHKGKVIHIGYFNELQPAIITRANKKTELHTFNPVQR